jgi:hypothetical protein
MPNSAPWSKELSKEGTAERWYSKDADEGIGAQGRFDADAAL